MQLPESTRDVRCCTKYFNSQVLIDRFHRLAVSTLLYVVLLFYAAPCVMDAYYTITVYAS